MTQSAEGTKIFSAGRPVVQVAILSAKPVMYGFGSAMYP